jgi:outer membrane receptor protein involved in Fe transport
MKHHDFIPHFKISTIALSISAALTFSQVVQAQENELEEITITGTRIRMTDGMAAPTPVTSLTPLELQAFEPGGTVAAQLDALPQFFGTGTAQRGGPALFSDGGGSYLDMRGLGRNRTLVLLDGSRVPPADKRGQVNVDNFPTALVRSVDVVTGGASAAYGADALGGVTNFVIDREFEGLKVSVGTGMNEFNQDGKNWNFSVAGGKQIGDRLNVIGSVEAREVDEIFRAAEDLDPDWFRRWGTVNNPAWKASDPPGTNPRRLTVPWITSRSSNATGIISARGTPLHGMTFSDDGSYVRPFVLGDISDTTVTSGGPEAARALHDSAGPISGAAVVNRSGFVGVKYDISDTFSVFGQAMLGRTESAATGQFSSFTMGPPVYALRVFSGNPYIPPEVQAIMDARGMAFFDLNKSSSSPDNLTAGRENSRTVFTTQSWQLGFDYVLPNGWDLRASWQSGESDKRGGEYPSTRIDREALSRDAVRDPATGAIVCNVTLRNPSPAELAASPSIAGLISSRDRSLNLPVNSPIGLDNSVRDCVPYNVMGEEGMSAAAHAYIHTPKMADTLVEQDFAEILLTGDLYEGWGYGALSFASGFTYREQAFADQALPAEIDFLGPPRNDANLGIRGIAPYFETSSFSLHHFSTIEKISGEYDVWEWFGELQMPLWESASRAQRVGGTLAYRTSEYSSSGRVESWKAGLEFQAFEDLRFRATKSRDGREASFAERFDMQTGGATVSNPWTGNDDDNPTVRSGGNPNLRPELANTLVFGFVYQPQWLDGLQLSTDWYQVEIHDAVDTISAQALVDQCFDVGALCENISYNSAGDISAILNPYLNLSKATVEGVDLEIGYRFEPDFFSNELESFSLRAIAGHLIEKTETPLGGATIDSVGGRTFPENTGNLTANYNIGPWSLQWQQRFIDEVLITSTWVEGVDIDDNTVPFFSWTNARIGYRGEMNNGATWNLGFNVNNLFDKNPPIFASSRGQSTSNSWDVYGRRYQLSLNMTF